MGEDFSSEVDKIIEDTLTVGDDDSLNQGVNKRRESDQQGVSEVPDEDEDNSTQPTRDVTTRREELWEELERPPQSENIVSYVCEAIGLSESVQDEAIDLIEKGSDAGLPIYRTRVVWSLSAIKRASEIHGESVEWDVLTNLTDMSERGIEERTEKLHDLS